MGMRRLLTWLLVACLSMSAFWVEPAQADSPGNSLVKQAVEVLSYYGIITGQNGGDVDRNLTRAELAKLVTQVMHLDGQSSYYGDRQLFTDVPASHWAAGSIALAKSVGLMNGFPDGSFHPDDPVSSGQVITVFTRMAGLSPQPGEWPMNYFNLASDKNLLPPGVDAGGTLWDPVRRGYVFALLYNTLTQVKDYYGITLLQKYFAPMPPQLTVNAVSGTTDKPTVEVSGSCPAAIRITINDSEVPIKDGNFTASVPVSLGYNTITVKAYDRAGNMAQQPLQVYRDNGAPDKIVVTGPHQVNAGESATLQVQVLDTYGQPIPNRGDLSVSTPEGLGSYDPYGGVYRAPVSPAQGDLTFTYRGITAKWSISVVAGAAQSLAISPAQTAAAKGEIVPFVLQATDAYGNPVSVSQGVKWSATGGGIDAGGRYIATSTGDQTITAQLGNATIQTVVHVYGEAVALKLSQAGSMIANGQDQQVMTVTAVDAAGNRVPTVASTVTLRSSAPSIAAPQSNTVQLKDGMATFQVVAGNAAGVATIYASVQKLQAATTPVTVSAQQLFAIRLQMDPATISADGKSTAQLYVTAVDQRGNPLLAPLSQPLTVRLVSSNQSVVSFLSTGTTGQDVIVGTLDPVSGTVRTAVTLKSGSTVAKGNITGTVINSTSYVQVNPVQVSAVSVGSAARVAIDPLHQAQVGTELHVYVRVLDSKGNQLTSAESLQGISVTLSDQNGRAYPVRTNLLTGNGKAEFALTPTSSDSLLLTATGTLSGVALTPATATVSLSAGPAVGVRIDAEPTILRADGNSQGTLTASIVDMYGNLVTNGSYQVTFQRISSGGAVKSFPDQTVTSNSGLATVIITAGTAQATDRFTAKVTDLTTLNSVNISSAIIGVPVKLGFRWGDNNADGKVNGPGDGTVQVGTPLTVYVDELDNQNPAVIYTPESGKVVTLLVKNLTTGEQATYSERTQYGTATFTVLRKTAGVYALEATSYGLTPVATTGYGGSGSDIVFTSGSGAKLSLITDLTKIKADRGISYATLQVGFVDPQGNTTVNSTGGAVVVTLKASSLLYGNFLSGSSPTDTVSLTIPANASVSTPVNFYSAVSPGTTAITASATGLDSGSVAINTVFVGPAATVQFGTIQDTSLVPANLVDPSSQGQLIDVVAYDAQNNQVTDYGTNDTDQITLQTGNSDTVVVAWYNFSIGAWVNLADTLGQYKTSATVKAYKGKARFRTSSSTSGVKTYQAALGSSIGTSPVSAQGTFKPAPLDRLVMSVDSSYAAVAGGAKDITLVARFSDAYGNTISTQTGRVTFAVNTTLGRLLTYEVDAVQGVARVVFETADGAPNGSVVVSATTIVTRPDGTSLTSGSSGKPATVTFQVDSNAPQVATALVVSPNGNQVNRVMPGDYLTVTFNEPIRPEKIFSTLQTGAPITDLGNVAMVLNTNGSDPDTITFENLHVGTLTLPSGSIVNPDGSAVYRYGISSLQLTDGGTRLILVVGNPSTSSGFATVVIPDASSSTPGTFAGDPSIQDLAGNVLDVQSVTLSPNSQF